MNEICTKMRDVLVDQANITSTAPIKEIVKRRIMRCPRPLAWMALVALLALAPAAVDAQDFVTFNLNLGATYTNYINVDSIANVDSLADVTALTGASSFGGLAALYNLRVALEADFLFTLASFLKLGVESGLHSFYIPGGSYISGSGFVLEVPFRAIVRFDILDWLYLQPSVGVLTHIIPDPLVPYFDAGLRVGLGPVLLEGAFLYQLSDVGLNSVLNEVNLWNPNTFRVGVFFELLEL